ncbi:MAG: permease [Candidatus Omnitrophica bacterium]|nr:permease [Candidatus Omnitrophota bacterium]
MLLIFSRWLVADVLRLDPASRWGSTVEFFFYDTVKITVLLVALIFIIGVVRTFIPAERIRRWMSLPGGMGYVAAAIFGAVTPFCSCSSIPIFFTFLKAGAPLGVTFSFLITSPLVNEYVVVLMAGFFGWKIAALYAFSGIVLGIVCGFILGKMKLERFIVEDMGLVGDVDLTQAAARTWTDRLKYGWDEAVSILSKIWIWVIAGVALGAAIHNYVPQSMVDAVTKSTGIWSVPLATLVGVPMYGSCAAIVPIAIALFQKGVPLGTALAFMMAIAALSLPEAVMLRRAMRLQLILIFFGVTTVGIIATGYLFNAVQHFFIH